MILWQRAKRELKRRLTIMLIPHNSIKPLRITFTLSFLLFLMVTWTGLTLWAGYWASRHVEYWKIRSDHSLMKLKVMFFAQQMKKSQEMLDQVRENDQQLRTLLEMRSKKAIIETEGKGGPTSAEARNLELLLSGMIHEMSHREIHRQSAALQEETKRRLESFREIIGHVEKQRVLFRATPALWPCLGRITSRFGMRFHPLHQSDEFHAGLDIANEKNTGIRATADGTVRLANWEPGYGRLVIVDHDYGYRTYYGHLNKILVKRGDFVRRGHVIGLMGSTGTSTGNHVHYEIQYFGRPVNPVRFLKKTSEEIAMAMQ